MATFDNNLRIKEIATGAEAGSWGTSTNTNLSLIADALGYATEATFDTDGNKTVSVANATSSPYRSMYVKVTSSATLSATRDLTIGPNTIKRVMFIENATTGGQSIVVKQGSGANVTIANGSVMCVYLDGAGAGAAVVSVFTDFVAKNFTAQDSLKITGTTPTLTIGDGDAEDNKITFFADSGGFTIGQDNSGADFVIGSSSTLGTGARMQISEQGAVEIISDAPANGQLKLSDIGSNSDEVVLTHDAGVFKILSRASVSSTGSVIIGGQNNSSAFDYMTFASTGMTTSLDIEITQSSASKSIILRSPNGTRYRINVDNSGNLSTTAVWCIIFPMDEKQFLIIAYQLIEVSLQRGAIKGEELEVINQMRKHVTAKLKEMQEPVTESVGELVEEKSEDKEEK